MTVDKTFPILTGYNREEKRYQQPFSSIPWSLIEVHKKLCHRNHYQSPEQLAIRGGLSASELAAVLEDRLWRQMELDDAFAIIKVALEEHSS